MYDSAVFSLLKKWCDRLLELQVNLPSSPKLDGAILCPACGLIHGRFADLCYPLVYLWRKTGEEKYLTAAKRSIDWTEQNMVMPSGLWRNDFASAWFGISAFGYMALYDALQTGGDALPKELRVQWSGILDRLESGICREFMSPSFRPNVNYFAAGSAVMCRAYLRSNKEIYRKRSIYWSDLCLSYMTDDNMLFGEGHHGADRKSLRGYRAVDIGYNGEESIPLLLLTAKERGDLELDQKASRLMDELLNFMLPDGALDNSWGARAAKWTYYGSRTSDGLQGGLILHPEKPMWMEAAYRNFQLYTYQTYDNLLTGGWMHREAGEPACVHHAFTHAKVLTHMAESELAFSHKTDLPSDSFRGIKSYSSCGIHLIGTNAFCASVYTSDHTDDIRLSPRGGSLTLLWSRICGPILAATMNDYFPVEPQNMQNLKDGSAIMNMTPRVVYKNASNVYDGDFHTSKDESSYSFTVVGYLKTKEGQTLSDEKGEAASYRLSYTFDDEVFHLTANTNVAGGELVLPLISAIQDKICLSENSCTIIRPAGKLAVNASVPFSAPYGTEKRFFHPVGGFDHLLLTLPIPREGLDLEISVL